MEEYIYEFIKKHFEGLKYSSGWIVAACIFVFFFLNPENLFIWKSAILSMFKTVSLSAEKSMISNRLRGEILKVSKEVSKENKNLIPYDLKIEWVEDEDKDTFLRNNQVIVRMSQSRNPHKNLVYAMLEYVKKGLLPNARLYIDKKILEASDLTIIRKMLALNYKDSLSYFHNEILDPAISNDDEVKELIQGLIQIDNNGMLVPILLNEFSKASLMIYPEPPDDCLKYESKEFLRFLKNIATKEPGEASELVFNQNYFKVAVGLAANPNNYNKLGRKFYIDKVFNSIDKGIETVYILGLGKNKEIAEKISLVAKENDIRIKEVKHHYYKHKFSDGNFTNGVCIEVKTFTKLDYEYEDAI